MTWEEQLKVEKGMMGKIASLIKRMKDASFERKIRKFLRQNLVVKYEKKEMGYYTNHKRTTDRDKSLGEAKTIFLDIVEKAWDEEFPDEFDVLDPAIYDDSAP
jgi:hypothetical protein